LLTWLGVIWLAVIHCTPANADVLASLLTRVLQESYAFSFEQQFISASDLFERREYGEAAVLFRALHRDARGEPDKELLRGYTNASYYGARRNRDGLDFLCTLSGDGADRSPAWLVHDAHAHIRAVAMRDGFATGIELALQFREACKHSAFSPIWVGVPLVKMEKLSAGVFVLDEAYSLDYSDEQLLGYVLRTYPEDPYADYARYFLHRFDEVSDDDLRALIDHRPTDPDVAEFGYPSEYTTSATTTLAQIPVGEVISALSADRTTEDGATFLRSVVEALFQAGRYADLEHILNDAPAEISAVVFANPGSRYHEILNELRARRFARAGLSHADAERLKAIEARPTCGNVSDCIFYATAVPGSRKAQRIIEAFLTRSDARDLAAFREAIDAGQITDLAIAHLVERLENRRRAGEIAQAVQRELSQCGCSEREFIEARSYDARYVSIYRTVFDLEYSMQIEDGPHESEHWRRLARLVDDTKARRYADLIVSRSHDFKTALIERVANLLVADDPDDLLEYAIEVRGHCNYPNPSGGPRTVCRGYPQAAASLFRLIANEYPETIAGEKALFLYAQLMRTRLGWGGHEELAEFIAAYPDSPLVDDASLELALLIGPGDDPQRFVAQLKSIATIYAEHNTADNALYALAEYHKERGDLFAAARYYADVGARFAASRLGRAAIPQSETTRRAWLGLASRKRVQGLTFYGTYIDKIDADADVVSDVALEPYDQLIEFSGAPIEDDLEILAALSNTNVGDTMNLVFERLEWDEDTEKDVTLTIHASARIAKIEWFDVARVSAGDHLMLRARPHWQSEPSEQIAYDQTCIRYAGDERTLSSGAVWFKVRTATRSSSSSVGWVNARFLQDAPECAGD
jgi:hypothetical protein